MNGALGTTVTGSDAREGLALDAETLCEAFQATVALRPHVVALRTWDGDVEVTWREYAQRVVRVAAGLQGLGVRRGETVALMLTNRPEFHFCDTAGIASRRDAVLDLQHLRPRSDRAHVRKRPQPGRGLRAGVRGPGARRAGGDVRRARDLHRRRPRGDAVAWSNSRLVAARSTFMRAARTVQPDDVLTLIYTSGTTGPPKGVEITHARMLAMTRAWTSVMPTGPDDRVLSYLPAAHIVDRMTGHYLGMTHGVQLTLRGGRRRARGGARRGAPHAVDLCATRLGEAAGCTGERDRQRPQPDATRRHAGRNRGGAAQGRGRAGSDRRRWRAARPGHAGGLPARR